MSRWLIYDTIQQRFIVQQSPRTMKHHVLSYRSREAAQAKIDAMGFDHLLMPLEYKKGEHMSILKTLPRSAFTQPTNNREENHP